ncbi:MAG TPA: hypothetical protein VF551_03260, partial [Chthoniobacterales bacterium]
MASQDGGGFRLNVLNPGGNDPEQHFESDAAPNERAHAPVNFHAYAACTRGSFLRSTSAAVAARRPVLLLLRGDFRSSERAFDELKKAGVPVAVSLKETGLHQIADQLSDRAKVERFMRMVAQADGCIAATPEAADIYRAIRRESGRVEFIPTPYPLHDAHWDFSRPVAERRGIFVGTREWDIPSRNHIAALIMARDLAQRTGETVTVYEFEGRAGARLVGQLGFAPNQLRILTSRTTYADYLRVLAGHRIVFQLDTSFVPGQVAGDALLCRLPCVGGNGAIDRLAHSATCGAGRSGEEMTRI